MELGKVREALEGMVMEALEGMVMEVEDKSLGLQFLCS
jgi:hypothetical protein